MLVLAFTWLTLSCVNEKVEPLSSSSNPGEVAQTYFSYLIDKDYDKYVSVMLLPDNAPDSYREHMSEVAKGYVEREAKEKGGLISATLQNVEIMSKDTMVNISAEERTESSARATLKVEFGNGNTEDVIVVLVEKDKHWLIR